MTTNSNPERRIAPARTRRRLWAVRFVAFMLLLAGLCTLDLAVTWVRRDPDIAALRTEQPAVTNQMRRNGFDELPTWTPADSIPGLLACAVIIAEDPRFHAYTGVDWGRQRQIASRVLHGDLSFGGSGIAQQLARNLYLAPKFTPRRKLREWLLAINIGRALPHQRQLELYLNVAQWGPTAWGVADGAREIFDKPLLALTPSEAVVLAAALPAPTRGLSYAMHPARRAQYDRIINRLWSRGALTDVEASATAARLKRLLVAVAAGAFPAEAQQRVIAEMGEELPWIGPPMPALVCADA